MTHRMKVLASYEDRVMVQHPTTGDVWIEDEQGASGPALSRAEADKVRADPSLMMLADLLDAEARTAALTEGVRPTVAEETGDDGEGRAYWVRAILTDGRHVRYFAAPAQPIGLEPCGGSIDDWCDVAARTAYGDDVAVALGMELLARAGSRSAPGAKAGIK